MNVNFNGLGENVATFIANPALTETGVPVKMSADGTVSKCVKNDLFCGVCTDLRDGYATVQLSGYVTMKASAKINAGYKKLATGDNDVVAEYASGREYLVLDSTATSVGFIL